MAYIPDRGHVIWIANDLKTGDPQAGREQVPHRPEQAVDCSSLLNLLPHTG